MKARWMLLAPLLCSAAWAQLDSWNDTPAKRAIVMFITRAATPGPGFIEPRDRIATFDNDGTLWPEQPLVEGMFVAARVKAYVASHPEARGQEPYKSLLERDREYFEALGPEGALKTILAVLQKVDGDVSRDDFLKAAREFYQTASYPKPRAPIKSIAYEPMLQLLAYLRANGFETWICTGGTMDFVRAFSEDLYGIPPQQVIGSRFKQDYRKIGDRMGIWRKPEIDSINDKNEKPVNIALQIGKRPALAAGNVRSGGDVAHLSYSAGRDGPSLQLMINHDDAAREFEYSEPDHASLDAARAGGWIVVSMKNDWKTIFASSKAATGGQK